MSRFIYLLLAGLLFAQPVWADLNLLDANQNGVLDASDVGADPDGTAAAAVSNRLVQVPDYAAAQALTGLSDGGQVSIAEEGRGGLFVYRAGDYTAQVTADTQHGVYLPLTADATGASGCLVRQYSGPVMVEWFGAVGNGTTDNTTILASILNNFPEVKFSDNGVYVAGRMLLAHPVNIRLGSATLLLKSASGLGAGQGFIEFDADDIHIYDGIIDGNRNNQDSQTGAYLITGTGVSNPQMYHTKLQNYAGGGVAFFSSPGGVINGVSVINVDRYPILFNILDNAGALVGPIITFCSTDQTQVAVNSGIGALGIRVVSNNNEDGSDYTYAVISHNKMVFSSGAYTSSVTNSAIQSSGGEYTFNTIIGGSIGVTVKYHPDMRVSFNSFRCYDYGVEVTNTTTYSKKIVGTIVSYNSVYGARRGIAFTGTKGADYTGENITFAFNNFYDCDNGINAWGVDGLTITGNNSAGSTSQGIVIRDCTDILISQGRLSFSTGSSCAAIQLYASSGVTIDHVIGDGFAYFVQFYDSSMSTIDHVQIKSCTLKNITAANFVKNINVTLGPDVSALGNFGISLANPLYDYVRFTGSTGTSIINLLTDTAPTLDSGIGSTAIVTTGATSTVYYVKEAAGTGGWVAK